MSGPERTHTWGCTEHEEDTYEACHTCDMHDFSELQAKYNELLFAVARAFPGESRHQTALRYITRAEAVANEGGPAKQARTT